MASLRIDHLYRETVHWAESVAWWENLGFTFETTWGAKPHRAGILINDVTRVVLAEAPVRDASSSVFLTTDDLEWISQRVDSPIVDTHWGTRMVNVTDPDDRAYNFEPEDES
jgi:hypothetical protein